MRPAWRLAISSLSGRPSRTALLVATVALSAALIAAVACAMRSMNDAVKRQAEAAVGTADVIIRPSGTGKTLDPDVLARAAAWPGAARALGTLEAPLTIAYTMDAMVKGGDGVYRAGPRRLTANALASGYSAIDSAGIKLMQGRLPRSADEIVIDASLAQRLIANANAPRSARSSLPPGRYKPFTTPAAASLPESADEAAALAINTNIGVRVGDRLQVVRQLVPQIGAIGPAADKPEKSKVGDLLSRMGEAASLMASRPVDVTVVGIAAAPPLGGRPRVITSDVGLSGLLASPLRHSEVAINVAPGVDAEAFVVEHRGTLAAEQVMQTSTKITSGLDRNMESSRLGFLLATVMAFLSSAFIITTGMTTSVAERQRELGMLRCIGASKWQLAWSQLAAGGLVGVAGAAVGVPAGIGLAAGLVELLKSRIEVSLATPPELLAVAAGGAIVCGLLGAAFPAWRSTRVSPLAALASRATPPRARGVLRLVAAGLALVAYPLCVVTFVDDGQLRFWLYATSGLPSLFVGFFLLSVPAFRVAAGLLSGVVSAAMRLPPNLLRRTVASTPYRHGFTSGAMMSGLALMVGIWTQGSSIQRDWLDKLEFPDAFVVGLNLRPQSQQALEKLDFVTDTCAITLHAVETDSFGIRALQKYRSTFMAFEPEPFFRMMKPVWVEGDPKVAIPKLEAGGAVIVAREFQVAQGLGVGDTFVCRDNDQEFRFEIVGVVTSPGLEIVSQFFNIGEDFTQQSIHAVFGSRKDLKEKFGSDAINLIQMSLKPGIDDEAAIDTVRETLAGAGVLDAGSGRRIKNEITGFIRGGLLAISSVAVLAMFIAGFGVANLIIAGIAARQFEFGVLTAIGAGRGLVARSVLAEAVLIALTAMVMGTLLGLTGVYCIQRIDEKLFGLVLTVRPPVQAIGIAWGVVALMTLGAAAPAVVGLLRKRPRELLSAVRG